MQASTSTELGLRERKKARTRVALIEAALRLYREHGFEGVTVAEIARGADVSTRTFFSYFEAKEDVFLGRGDDRLERLVAAIRERRPGEPILTAARRELIRRREPNERNKVERSSPGPGLDELLRHPAIAARLRERWNRWEDILAVAIATDVGARPEDPEPRVVAAAITGAIRVAASAAEEQPGRRHAVAERVFDLLAAGLADFGAVPHLRRPSSVATRRIR